MKNKFKFISIFLLICILINLFSIPVYAKGDVDIIGQFKNSLSLKASEECFSSKNLVAPGDYWSSTIVLKNVDESKYNIEVRLSSITSNLEDTTLFDLMELKIFLNNKLIYDGPYNGNVRTEYFKIRPEQEMNMLVIMGIPASVKNVGQGKVMDSTWTFEARGKEPMPGIKEYNYTVKYQDKEGNTLHPDKTDKARLKATVTEYPVNIEGYTPLDDELSLKISQEVRDNIIVFIYDKIDEDEGDNSDLEIKEYEYTVKYQDKEGNTLHPDKIDKAKLKAVITELPVDIKGYKPLDEFLIVKITQNPEKNVIIFIYDKKAGETEPVDPDITDPTPGDDSGDETEDNTGSETNPEDNPNPDNNKPGDSNDPVKTGTDKEVAPWIAITIGSCIVLFFFIIAKKKKKKDEDKENKK